MEKEIGGYFSLELSKLHQTIPALSGVLLNTGRNSIEYILRSIKHIKKLYIPYYTCDTVLEPIAKLKIDYEFYHINNRLEIEEHVNLGLDEYIIYTNYFGIKDKYVDTLISFYRGQLIVDNAQALFAEPVGNCAYSPRKFVGVPDGGMAFTIDACHFDLTRSTSFDICSHLLKRIDCGGSSAYADFRANSKVLAHLPIQRMSRLTESLLQNIDYEHLVVQRKNNFDYLHSHLAPTNQLVIPSSQTFQCPMVYPYYVENDELRKKLIEHRIYVATYWPNIFRWCKEETTEYKLAEYILPLPIDQRYNIADMDRIINTINKG